MARTQPVPPPHTPPGQPLPPIPKKFIPQHVAVVMDGNGRWANGRGHPDRGPPAGEARTVGRCCGRAIEMGIPYVTAYTRSPTENWKCSPSEVAFLCVSPPRCCSVSWKPSRPGVCASSGVSRPLRLCKERRRKSSEHCERETIDNTGSHPHHVRELRRPAEIADAAAAIAA